MFINNNNQKKDIVIIPKKHNESLNIKNLNKIDIKPK